MNREYCEQVRISAMVLLDGEVPQLSESEIKKHVESCADCQLDLEQQRQAIGLLGQQIRQVCEEDVWPLIAPSIEATRSVSKPLARAWLFVILCIFLVVHKIIEVLPAVTAGVAIKLIPVGVIILFFGLLKENPFKINQNLRLEGETRC